ncbi:TKL family protein kinase [Histomonas meleagridis]|uniref:TKL family protein kinase n=1 Tax=Histomonas meleagridis TaxID=135588 RepID=UPI0035593F5A|nr:TKL family protein kinase [Histomonas meleagridis]KAH0799719.1 TKL family protein kinase [Histomonas meleagridis]
MYQNEKRTPKDFIFEFDRVLHELEQLAEQVAVHKKKFEYSVNQFRRFLTHFTISARSTSPITACENSAIHDIFSKLNELNRLLTHHQSNCWAQTTLEYPINSIPLQLCNIAQNLRNSTYHLDPEGSLFFEPDPQKWVQFHILDLKAISVSFHNYINSNGNEDVVSLMNARLRSINIFLKQYENESIIAPGIRIFSPIPVHYQSWRVKYSDFDPKEEIGSGISANVYYGFDKRTGNEVAIKKLKFKELTGAELNVFQREVIVLSTAIHPTLVGFVGATDTPPYCIITEWMSGGTLYQELQQNKRLNPTMRTIAAFDIARGMEFLHSRHIIHRDLKSLNVLFDSKGFAHICDFGFSRNEDDVMTGNVGTPHWMAPELLGCSVNYTSKVDVYSYGILLWEIVSESLPYEGMASLQIVQQVYINNLRPQIPKNAPTAVKELIKKCWDRNPDVRPTFKEIVSMFQSGKILFNGANHDEFMRYVNDKIGNDEKNNEIELENKLNKSESIEDIVKTLQKNGIPSNLQEKCWELIECCTNSPEYVAKAAILFLKTPLKTKAASLLRSLPMGSLSPKESASIAELIPSGSDEFDDDIAITACKNGAADAIAVYAVSLIHVKLALELVVKQGVDVMLKAAVADRCVQGVYSNDESLACISLRCLISIGEFRRIPFNAIQKFLNTEDNGLKDCIFTAIMAASKEQNVSNEIMDFLLKEVEKNSIAVPALLAICRDEKVALYVLERMSNYSFDEEIILKLMFLMCQNRALHSNVLNALELFKFNDKNYENVALELMNYIKSLT